MVHTLIRNWWAVVTVGVLAIILGVSCIATPGLSLASLVLAFGAYAIITGVVQIVAGLSRRTGEVMGGSGRTWLVISGVLGVIAGVVTFTYPAITAVALYTIIAVWAILSGVAHIATAIANRHDQKNTWPVALGGFVSVLFGGYLLMQPVAGAIALAVAIGVFAIAYGAAMIAGGFMLKSAADAVDVRITRLGEAPLFADEERVSNIDERRTPL